MAHKELSPLNKFTRNSVMFKVLSIGFLILLLLIPTAMVEGLIRDRQYRQSETIQEVSSLWGNPQRLSGPIITIPYEYYVEGKDDKLIRMVEHAHFLPEALNIEGRVETEIRYRGIYKVVVYTTKLDVDGTFRHPSFADWGIPNDRVLWKDAFMSVGIADLRGIQENINITWNDTPYEVNPGIDTKHLSAKSGVSVRLPITAVADTDNGLHTYSFELNLNGSQSIHFEPLGKETNVKLSSNWNKPSFNGAFTSDNFEVSDDGFSADWQIFHLNRNFPQQWRGPQYQTSISSFGVNLLLPIDQYQQTNRAAKYAIMIISLTFLLYFFVEILNKVMIHPIQYILVGLSLVIFYTLLLSISERSHFNFAYVISSIAIITLITAYSKSIFKDMRLTAVVGGVLTLLYAFIFIVLQLEELALLMGSIGLFLVMALVMYLSRKIDWYNLSGGKEVPAE